VRVRRIILWSVVGVVGVVLLAGGVLYLLVSLPPAGYEPAELAPAEQQAWARDFVERLAEVNNRLHRGEPLTFRLTEEQANAYLASLDEIDAIRPDPRGGRLRRGRVKRALEEAQLADPAVTFRDGVLRLMVRSMAYNKVLAADVRLEFSEDRQRIRVRLMDASLGRLSLPESAYRPHLDELKRQAQQELEEQAGGNPAGGDKQLLQGELPSAMVAELGLGLLAALDGEPVPTEHQLQDWLRVRIEEVTIEDKELRIRVQPRRVGPAGTQ